MTLPVDDHASQDVAGVPRRLRPGIKLLLVSLVLIAGSWGLFCYALDLTLDEGWALAADGQRAVKRVPLALAMLGFGASILVFWFGYLSLSRR